MKEIRPSNEGTCEVTLIETPLNFIKYSFFLQLESLDINFLYYRLKDD